MAGFLNRVFLGMAALVGLSGAVEAPRNVIPSHQAEAPRRRGSKNRKPGRAYVYDVQPNCRADLRDRVIHNGSCFIYPANKRRL